MMFTLSELFSYTPPVPTAFWYWCGAMILSALLVVYFYQATKGGKKK